VEIPAGKDIGGRSDACVQRDRLEDRSGPITVGGKKLIYSSLLEAWYEAGWANRPAAVERLRELASSIMTP
jgi:hypothetical protein